jgi:uncharacterized protein DUF4202
MAADTDRLRKAFAAIDAANALDPKSVLVDGASRPANLVYGLRMSAELERFAPDASEALQIAARGQHIERWIIPRSQYPMDRPGYHRWRLALRDHHAARLSSILTDLAYDQAAIARVASIVRKERPKEDGEVQTLEDVICIVFVKHELQAFAPRYADDDTKLADILAKTWRKMSERGHAAVLAIPPEPSVVALLHKGLERLQPAR